MFLGSRADQLMYSKKIVNIILYTSNPSTNIIISALTVTGLVYGWGDNKVGQACPQFPLAVCSIPKQIVLPVGEVAYDITALNDQVCMIYFQ